MNQTYEHPIRVYYDTTDAVGLVYHANYLVFAEQARTEWLRNKGLTNPSLAKDHNIVFVVSRSDIRFKAPAYLDDELIVKTKVIKIAGVTIDMAQHIMRNGKEIVSIDLRLASINNKGRPQRIPTDILTILKE